MINAALAYDFDGTLVPGHMQNHSFFPTLGVDDPYAEFWQETKRLAQQQDADEILVYMYQMLREAEYKGVSIRKEKFVEHGNKIPFFPGVEEWFPRINEYAESININLKHYIISSGLREMIEGTSIASNFTAIFASGYMYNQDDIAVWPALAVNYTNKTQYIFRINKGINNSWDNESLNEYWADKPRPVPQQNIMYFGDGETDVPAMKMVNYLGGKSVSVYDANNQEARSTSEDLVSQERASYCAAADYQENSELDLLVKNRLQEISKIPAT